MENLGFIKLHRKITEWEWYDDSNTFRLFIHLLLLANFEPKKWRGKTIQRGEVFTGRQILANSLHLSEMQIRTSISKLKSTNEITILSTRNYSIIKLINYDAYQQNNQQNNQRVTNEQPTSNQRVTTTKNVKNVKNDKNITPNGVEQVQNENEKIEYGNMGINKMLTAIRVKVQISAFVDSGIERNMAKHCVNLMSSIGRDEFVRRLDLLLKDPFHRKNCNKIKYIYNNIKGFIEPISRSPDLSNI